MEPKFWLDRWQNSDIGFHRDAAQPALERYWAGLGIEPGHSVFVPLCGMSPDMVWLAEAGHRVVGVELSDIAIAGFFKSQNLEPDKRVHENFEVYSAGPYELWAGDMFKLPDDVIRNCAAVYDRASLVALPDQMQRDYAAQITSDLAPGAQMFLIALTFNQDEMDGPPFSTPLARISQLFENAFDIEVLEENPALGENENLKKRGLTELTECCYRLRRKIHER